MKLSELYVESDKLDAAAAKCDIASGEAGAVKISDGLDEYGSGIRSAKQGYNTTDHSVSLDFKVVDKTLSEIA